VQHLHATAGNRAVSRLIAGSRSGRLRTAGGAAPADAPVVQRRLLAAGSPTDIKAFLGLLEPASGFTLRHDAKTSVVSATAAVREPRSKVLASRLLTIMEDAGRDARIHLGRNQEGVSFGAFPTQSDNPVQELRIDHFLALEQGAPGAGVGKLAHEVVENYTGSPNLAIAAPDLVFPDAHKAALEAENLVDAELDPGTTKTGDRRNTFSVVRTVKGRQFFHSVESHDNGFVVWDESFDGKGTVSNARRVPRERVGVFTVAGFQAGSKKVPDAAAATVAAIVAAMKQNPTASARLEAFADIASVERDAHAADPWSEALMNRVVELAGDEVGLNWRRFDTAEDGSGYPNRVVVTLDRPSE
jgi:hypothetical protein